MYVCKWLLKYLEGMLTKTTRMTWKKSPNTLMYKLCSNFCSAVHVYMYNVFFFTFCVDFVPCNTIKHILWRRTNCIYFDVDVDWNEDQIIILLLQRRAVLILNLSYDKAYFLFFEAFLGIPVLWSIPRQIYSLRSNYALCSCWLLYWVLMCIIG